MPVTIPFPLVQGRPWRFGKRQRLSVAPPKAYWPQMTGVATPGAETPSWGDHVIPRRKRDDNTARVRVVLPSLADY
jgi:hypothetical protein